MKWLKALGALILLAAILAGAALFAAPGIERWRVGIFGIRFQYQFTAGQETAYTQTMSMVMLVQGAQVPHAINPKDPAAESLRQFASMAKSHAQMIATTDMAYRQRIMSVDAKGSASIQGIIEDMYMSMSVNGQRLPTPNTAAYKGKTYTMIMSPRGEISDYATAFDPVAAPTGGTGDLQKSMNQITAVFPDRPVKPGESWDKDIIPDPVPGVTYDAKIHNHYTFTGLERLENGRTCARVDVKIHMRQKSILHEKGVMSTTTAEGDGKGVIFFDINAGQIVKNKLNLAFDTTLRMESGQKGQVTMTNAIDMVTEAK